jgi:hypothetical protein
MIVSTLIKSAMRKVGVLSSGESPETAREAEALEALQVMLRSWAQKRILVFASVKESFILISGQSVYTWGTGGVITTTRPHQVIGAFVRDSNGTDNRVKIISEGEYRIITSKTASGRPECLFYHPLYPLGAIYLYPTPQDIETMWVDSLKPFTETSSFTFVTDEIDFPPNYLEPLIYNLALRLAPEYGVSLSAEAIKVATEGYDALVILNLSNQVESININLQLPVGSNRGGYDINAG